MARKFKTPITIDELGSASSQALAANVDGDSQNRVNIDAGGKITWGSGSATGDTTLYRSAADTLKTDDAFTAASLAVTGEFTLPTSDGSANQVLQTDGSGTVSWAAVSGSGSPGGSDGQVQYNNGGAFGGASSLYYDDVNDRVGIGTTSPDKSLHIYHATVDHPLVIESGDVRAGLEMKDSTTVTSPLIRASGDDLQLRTGGSDNLVIKSDGKVGIGTTTPSYLFSVNGQAEFGAGNDLTPNSNGAGHLMILGNGYRGFASLDGAAMWLGHNSNGRSLHLATDETARLTVTGTGNVGIGTTSPDQTLDVDGALAVRSKMVMGTSTFTQEPWSGSTIAFANYGSIGTQGSYRASWAWNYERGTDSGWHALGINSYTSAAGIDLGNDGILFRADSSYAATGQPTTRMAIEPGGKVGIGTSSPVAGLDIATTAGDAWTTNGWDSGLILNAASALRWRTASGVDWGIGNSGSTLYFMSSTDSGTGAAADYRMVINSSGHVGIGTSSPAQRLHVNSGNTNTTSVFESTDGTAIIGIKDSNTSGNIYVGVAALGDDLRLRAGNAYRMHIDSNGYVGIATTSPAAPLHVFRNDGSSELIRLTNSASENQGPYIGLYDLNSRLGYMGFPDNDDLHIKNESTSGRIYMSTNNTTRMTVHQNGDVGIATSAPTYKLDVNGDSRFSDRMIIRANGSDILTLEDSGGTDEGGYINFANSNGTSMGYFGFGNNDDIHLRNSNSGGNVYMGVAARWALQIDTSGNLLPYSDNVHNLGGSGRAWNHFYLHQGNTFSSGGYWTLRSRDSDRQVMEYTSSERFKKDIVDLPTEEAYQILDARVIKFRGIDDDDTVPLEAGLSAESLHEAGFEYAVRYDEGHWGETPRSVYYEMLTAPLIKICKDQKERIESLESRVAALEAG